VRSDFVGSLIAPAMVSTGIKSSEFPFKHLAKTFYFVFYAQFADTKYLWYIVRVSSLFWNT
ncbi:hypothetical protein JYT76_04145, partial [Olleya sp. AH-315-F22]|nr:hypothetical protein [Olleya sp. AH-315-F22]